MNRSASFGDILEAVDQLSIEDQEALAEIIHRRAAELGREQIANEAQEARHEFTEGRCRPATTDELMDEILS